MHGCLGERVVVSHKPASPYFGYNARPRGKNARFRCILASQSDQLLLPHKNSLESALVPHHCDKYRSKTLLLGYPTIPRAQWVFSISTCTAGAWEWAITQTALRVCADTRGQLHITWDNAQQPYLTPEPFTWPRCSLQSPSHLASDVDR